jgi:hypothetical protein
MSIVLSVLGFSLLEFSAFRGEPRGILRIIQCIGKHLSCHLRGECVAHSKYQNDKELSKIYGTGLEFPGPPFPVPNGNIIRRILQVL